MDTLTAAPAPTSLLPQPIPNITSAELYDLHGKVQECRLRAEELHGEQDRYRCKLLDLEYGLLQGAEALEEIEAERA